MNDQIVSREMIRERARRAFAEGKSRNDHDMNWSAAALPTWQQEFDRLDAEKNLHGMRKSSHVNQGQTA